MAEKGRQDRSHGFSKAASARRSSTLQMQIDHKDIN